MAKPAIWFPTIRTESGSDIFTEQLVNGLQKHNIRAEITWLPHHAEYLPWLVKKPQKPNWANIVHINSWLHPKFSPLNTPIITNVHLCIQDPVLLPYKSLPQKLYHQFWITPIERKNIKKASHVIAVSRYTAEQVASFFKNRDTIDYIYNGIDTEIFTPGKKDKPSKTFRLLFAGNHSKRKGFDLLPEIMQQLGEGFELYYTAGRDTLSNNYPQNMLALPRLNYPLEMAEAYRNVDALLFPTRLEGFGLVAAEAMACGIPVIASNNSALPEVVEHGVTGLLCPQDDVNAFVTAIRQFADDTRLRMSLVTATTPYVQAKFGLDIMLKKYIQIYQQALTNR